MYIFRLRIKALQPSDSGTFMYIFRLRIKALQPSDSGNYSCRAWNSFGSVNTTGHIEVKDGM